jgi:phosphoribosylaminoimidazole-succinocarboxamide synthase
VLAFPTLDRADLPGLPLVARGKVRDVFEVDGALLLVATDRLSAFDCVFPSPIPDKGRVLNRLSAFWFERTRGIVGNHVIETDASRFPAPFARFEGMLAERSTLAMKLAMFPVECVARGYLAGSGWKDYRESGAIGGVRLPPGLVEGEILPEPIFTPATKAETGHDENIGFDDVVRLLGGPTAERLRSLTLALYADGAAHAASRGILVADTKFEFGRDAQGDIRIGDEMLTPDSSRFWPKGSYRPGSSPPSLDKQFVRDYVEGLGWNKKPPAPVLPPEIVEGLSKRYREIFETLTGTTIGTPADAPRDRSTKS